MTSEAPEFHTKTSTPVSPVPLHPAGPSKYPVLENQTDPIFNMTSAHLEVSEKLASPEYSVKQMPESAVTADIGSDVDAEGDIVDDSSFSDAYGEQEENTENTAVKAPEQNTTADDDDDYAMTFESDGELDSNRQDISNETSEPETQSAPAPVSSENPSSAALPATNSAPSITNDGPSLKSPTIPIPPAINGEIFALTESTAAPSSTETAQSQAQTQSTEGAEEKDDEIDIQQLLDNITATAELNASANATPTTASTSSPNFPASSGLSSHSSLPPRPQAVQKPPMHPAYTSQDDIRKYHAGPSSYAPPQLPSYRAPGMPMSIVAAGAPGTSTDPRNMLPPPPTASFNAPPSLNPPPGIAPAPYQQHQRAASQDRPKNAVDSADVDDEGEVQWGPEVQKLYDDFLADERMYVTEGLWDRFPTGSRLFIGNLPTEKVTKRDLFYVFYKYGRLAQVSIKQAYGFVQFHDVASCYNALDREQGQEVRGRKMHLEISKPQKNTRGAGQNQNQAQQPARRSRSPDYGGRGGRGQGPARNAGYDRYDGRQAPPPRDNDYRGAPLRARDDYRPIRSPSPPPPRASYRGRDEYPPRGGKDYYNGNERRRSRSRSPIYDRREVPRYRERSPTPPLRREANEDAELGIPRRNARDVPEVQIILLEELDRGFVGWVESEIRSRGLTTEVMFLSPRIPVEAVIRRQILEGVLAVTKLTRSSQDKSKIPLQVFDRTAGANNVRFDEYVDLEPRIAGELVLREKTKLAAAKAPPPQLTYAQPQYPPAQTYQTPPAAAPAAATPNLGNLVGQLDNATLQKLLGSLNSLPQQNTVAAAQNSQFDLAGVLSGLMKGQPQAPQQQQAYRQYQAQAQVPPAAAPNLASMLGGGGQQVPQNAQQVQDIMAQLARFRQ